MGYGCIDELTDASARLRYHAHCTGPLSSRSIILQVAQALDKTRRTCSQVYVPRQVQPHPDKHRATLTRMEQTAKPPATLPPTAAAAAAALLVWRDVMAWRLDIFPQRVMMNADLLALAQAQPRTSEDVLNTFRSTRGRGVRVARANMAQVRTRANRSCAAHFQ